jgi:hypothetical protein
MNENSLAALLLLSKGAATKRIINHEAPTERGFASQLFYYS